jgi:hypothetical protein
MVSRQELSMEAGQAGSSFMNALTLESYAMSMNRDKRHLDEVAAPASPALGSAGQQHATAERAEEILRRYRKAFSDSRRMRCQC